MIQFNMGWFLCWVVIGATIWIATLCFLDPDGNYSKGGELIVLFIVIIVTGILASLAHGGF